MSFKIFFATIFACAVIAVASAVDVKKQSEDLEPAAGTLGLYGGGLGHVYGYGSAGLAGPLYSSGLGFAGLGGAAGLGYAGVAGLGGAPFAYGGRSLHYGGGIGGVGLAGYGGYANGFGYGLY